MDVEMGQESTNSQPTETINPATPKKKPILLKAFVFHSNKNHSTNPTTLEVKTILTMGFSAIVGLLSVTYTINSHGNLVPTALFHQPTFTFSLFLIIIMTIFYAAAIGVILQKPLPKVTKVLNLISFVFLVLAVTVMLWTLIPNHLSWVPWIFFACTVIATLRACSYDGNSALLPTPLNRCSTA